MNPFINIVVQSIAGLFGGYLTFGLLMIILIGLLAWFNRAGLPVVVMACFIVLFGMRTVDPLFLTLATIVAVVGGIMSVWGILERMKVSQ